MKVYFVGTAIGESLLSTNEPIGKIIYVVRMADFMPCRYEQLPSISRLIEGILRQSKKESQTNIDGSAEEGLYQVF